MRNGKKIRIKYQVKKWVLVKVFLVPKTVHLAVLPDFLKTRTFF